MKANKSMPAVMATCHGDCDAPKHVKIPDGDGVGDEKDICDPIGNQNYYSALPGTHGDPAHRAYDQWEQNQEHPMVKQQKGRSEASNVAVLQSEAKN